VRRPACRSRVSMDDVNCAIAARNCATKSASAIDLPAGGDDVQRPGRLRSAAGRLGRRAKGVSLVPLSNRRRDPRFKTGTFRRCLSDSPGCCHAIGAAAAHDAAGYLRPICRRRGLLYFYMDGDRTQGAAGQAEAGGTGLIPVREVPRLKFLSCDAQRQPIPQQHQP
jgi:hypothetical protein